MEKFSFEDKLVKNLKKYRKIESLTIPRMLESGELVEFLRNRSEQISKIMNENITIIENDLRGILSKADKISEQEADTLFNLALRLYTITADIDAGLALEIHETLVLWSKERKDKDRLVRSLYFMGLICQQNVAPLFGLEGFSKMQRRAISSFSEAATYKEEYFSIEDKHTREYVNRSLGNIFVTVSTMRHLTPTLTEVSFVKHVNQAIAFWEDEEVRKKDPHLPWDYYIYVAHQNISTWIDVLSRKARGTFDGELIERIENSVIYVEKNSEKYYHHGNKLEKRFKFIKHLTLYYNNKISFVTLLNILIELYENTDGSDYSEDGQFVRLRIPVFIFEQLKTAPKRIKQALKEIENKEDVMIKNIVVYCRNAPSNIQKERFYHNLESAIMHASSSLDFDRYIQLLLNITSLSNLSTYVHSIMVRDLVEIIATHLINTQPQYFVGLFNTSSEKQVAEKHVDILNNICRAALCHDIGKALFLRIVTLNSRRLYDYEFDIMRNHTQVEDLLMFEGENVECITQVVRGHHLWYNGKAGYPADFDVLNAKYKPVIDIVTIADSIDAATDNIGRTYSEAITLEQVLAEIQGQAGTRYSPIVAKALCDKLLVEKIRNCITIGREIVYYSAYIDIYEKSR